MWHLQSGKHRLFMSQASFESCTVHGSENSSANANDRTTVSNQDQFRCDNYSELAPRINHEIIAVLVYIDIVLRKITPKAKLVFSRQYSILYFRADLIFCGRSHERYQTSDITLFLLEITV